MMVLLLSSAILILKITFSVGVLTWKQEIFVNGENGTDGNACIQGGFQSPCATINMALKGLLYNSTVIRISSGIYRLEQGNETTITGKNNTAIIGSGNKDTIIKCSPLTGLVFHQSSGVIIEFITFSECGQNVLYAVGTDYPNRHIQAAISLSYLHMDLMLNNVIIESSNGTGLFLMNVFGTLSVINCLITNNKVTKISNNPIQSGTNITNNEFSTVEYDCDFLGGGAIVLISMQSTLNLSVESCTISNNSRALFISGPVSYAVFYSDLLIGLENTNIFSNLKSSLVHVDNHFGLQLANVNMNDTLTVFVNGKSDINIQPIKTGYTISNDQFYMFVEYSNSSDFVYPRISFEEKNCDSYKGKCSEDGKDFTGHCPVSYSACLGQHSYCFCGNGHAGRLCGQCFEGYSVPINSHDLSCSSCDSPEAVVKGWAALIGLEFVPLLVMTGVIAVFNINLNQGSLNAYIFFCQILTMSFPSVRYPAWLASDYNHTLLDPIFDFSLIPLSMWNLDFINIPPSSLYSAYDFPICVSSSTTPLGALSFWYFIAFYPIFLLTLFYGCIVLYDRGHRCVTCVVRPVHRLLAHIWRLFDIKPSLSQTVASVYTLCFTQLAAISFKILHPVQYQEESGDTITVFFYDGTQQYFKGLHALTGMFAIFVLVLLLAVTIYLLMYPSKWFQHCLNRFKFKKDFLISVTDVLTGPYKDGTQNSWDYRYFAGIHFAIRLVIMPIYYLPLYVFPVLLIACFQVILCILFAISVVIFRPYKRAIHSFNEVLLLLVLGIFSFSCIYPSPSLFQHNKLYNNHPWVLLLVLPVCGFIVLFVVTPYCIWKMIRQCIIRYQSSTISARFIQQSHGIRNENDNIFQHVEDELFTVDRLVNPGRYEPYEPQVAGREHRIAGNHKGVHNSYNTF